MEIYDKLIEKAITLVAKKRYTSMEIDKKLRQFVGKLERFNEGLSFTLEDVDAAIEKVMARLKELRYLDDQKFAEDYVTDRVKFKPRGKFMIARELSKKGLDKEDINLATESVDELPMAKSLIEKRSGRWQSETHSKQREKAFRFLSSKGFTVDTIYKAIESHYNHDS